jgi:ribokinase
LPTQATVSALELAREHQCRVVFNYAPVNDVPLTALVGLSFIVVNEIESIQLAKKLGIEQAGYPDMCVTFGRILDTTAVVTLGSKGAFAYWEGRLYHVPTAEVRTVDPTGAGDAFCGILGAALYEGYDVLSALRLASVGGAIACTRHGAQNAVTSKAEIERLAVIVPLPYVYDNG